MIKLFNEVENKVISNKNMQGLLYDTDSLRRDKIIMQVLSFSTGQIYQYTPDTSLLNSHTKQL